MKAKNTGYIIGTDGHTRCWWPGQDPEYIRYHDEEWGRPVYDDTRLFEKLCLEGGLPFYASAKIFVRPFVDLILTALPNLRTQMWTLYYTMLESFVIGAK